MSNVPTTKDAQQTLMSVLNARKDMFREILPKYLTPERLFRVAQIAMSKNKALLACTPASFVVAMMDCAKSGLEPNGKDAALVPYGNECQFQPMYQGLIKQAVNCGAAKKIGARVVHANDRFKIWFDPEPHVNHELAIDGDEGEITGAYAYAILPDGTPHIEYMNRKQLDHIRAKAKAKSFSPWQTDEEEMYRKTPVKRLFKYLPVSDEVEYAVAVDNQHEIGKGRNDMPILEAVVTEPAETQTEKLKGKLKTSKKESEPPTTPPEAETPPEGQGEKEKPVAAITEDQRTYLGAVPDDLLEKAFAAGGIDLIPIAELDESTASQLIIWLKAQ